MTRSVLAIALAAALLSACGSGDDVPSDQAVKPAKAPAGWTTTDLGPVKVSAPTTWTKGNTTNATPTVKVTTWRASASGASPSGMEVKVISTPQQHAKKAATAIAINAMALLKSGRIHPDHIVWPNAKDAYYFAYDATSGTPPTNYATRTVVFDLTGGGQVQVTALAAKDSTDAAAPRRALESIVLDESS